MIKNDRQKFSLISIHFLQTHALQSTRVTKNLTNQIIPGRVTMKRSISESRCVAYIESEFTTATISIPGIHVSFCMYFRARSKRYVSWIFGSCLIQSFCRKSLDELSSIYIMIAYVKEYYFGIIFPETHDASIVFCNRKWHFSWKISLKRMKSERWMMGIIEKKFKHLKKRILYRMR